MVENMEIMFTTLYIREDIITHCGIHRQKPKFAPMNWIFILPFGSEKIGI